MNHIYVNVVSLGPFVIVRVPRVAIRTRLGVAVRGQYRMVLNQRQFSTALTPLVHSLGEKAKDISYLSILAGEDDTDTQSNSVCEGAFSGEARLLGFRLYDWDGSQFVLVRPALESKEPQWRVHECEAFHNSRYEPKVTTYFHTQQEAETFAANSNRNTALERSELPGSRIWFSVCKRT